jgi:signal transduction histidine kinase
LKNLVVQTKEIALKCSSQIRTASYLLHPPLLGEEGLLPVVCRLASEFEQRSGIRVSLDITEDLGRFPDVIEITIFRVIQEALANVLRHSGSPIVHLSLWEQSSFLKLMVSDEGREESTRIRSNHSGVGVSGMRERLEQLGGTFKIDKAKHGTTIIAAIPL